MSTLIWNKCGHNDDQSPNECPTCMKAENAKLRAELQGSMATIAALQMALDSANLQNGELVKALTELLDYLEITGNWTESGDSVALWLTLKEDQTLDALENRARHVLSGVTDRPKGNA